MRKLLFYLIIGLCAPLFAEEKLYTTEDYHIDVFGQDESEPINTGFFFHDGKYVEPPYIVKRLGISVFVNDVMVHIPVSYPLSSIRPISGKLPGMPKNITKESVPDDIVKFITEAFDYYFPKYYLEDGNNAMASDELQKYVSRISELPCVNKIILVKDNNSFGGMTIYLHNGDNFSYDWSEKFPARISETDRKDALKQSYENSFNEKVKMLKNNYLLLCFNKYLPASGVKNNPETIVNFVKIINSKAGASSKKFDLQKLFDFPEEYVDDFTNKLIENYQYSEELTKRVEALHEEWKKSRIQSEKPIEIKKPDIVGIFQKLKDWTRNHYPKDTKAKHYEWPCYQKEVGEKKGETINSGLVVLDGKPIPRPYTVSRKGLSVWINDSVLIAPPVKYPIELAPLPELNKIDYERIKENGINGVDDRYFEVYYAGLLFRYPIEEANKKLLDKFKSLSFEKIELLKVRHPLDDNDQEFVKIYDEKGTFLPEASKKMIEELRKTHELDNKISGDKKERVLIRVFDKQGHILPEDGSTPFEIFDLYKMRQQFQSQYGEDLSPEIYSKEKLTARYDEILKATEDLLKNNCCLFPFSNARNFPVLNPSEEHHRKYFSLLLDILKSDKTPEQKAEDMEKGRLFSLEQAMKILENEKSVKEYLVGFSK